MNPRLMARMLLAIAFLAGLNSAQGQDDPKAEKAKQAVLTFGAKLAAEDLDGLLKATAVPFLHNANGEDKYEVLRDREVLKKLMERLLGLAKGKLVKLELGEGISYAKLPEQEKDKLPKEQRKLFDEILAKDGYIWKVDVKDAKGDRQTRWRIYVASPEGQPKVVGLID